MSILLLLLLLEDRRGLAPAVVDEGGGGVVSWEEDLLNVVEALLGGGAGGGVFFVDGRSPSILSAVGGSGAGPLELISIVEAFSASAKRDLLMNVDSLVEQD